MLTKLDTSTLYTVSAENKNIAFKLASQAYLQHKKQLRYLLLLGNVVSYKKMGLR